MIEILFSFFLGATSSLVIGYYFYKKSSVNPPEWAKPLIAKLPENKPSKAELLKLFQTALDEGEAVAHVTGHVACPRCGTSAKNFKEVALGGNDQVTVLEVSCPNCGWSETAEL